MIEQLTHLMVNSGAAWVLWLLFALSFVSVAIALERLLAFRRTRGDVDRLVPDLRRLLRQDDHERAAQMLTDSHSVEGRVVAAGLAESDLGSAAAEEAMAAAMGLERKRLERRLLFLGTVGNNAPFVGLLGTVIGIVGAFEALGKPQALSQTITGAAAAANALAPERVMSTIAEALVATAVGLIVAIPAVAVFNYFQGRVTSALADAETLGHVLLAHLRAEHDPELAQRGPKRRSAGVSGGNGQPVSAAPPGDAETPPLAPTTSAEPTAE
jgi:biopolymer transport protein ExbB